MMKFLHPRSFLLFTIFFVMPFSGITQLSVVNISPLNTSKNISTNTKLVINFNQEVAPGNGSIFIYTNGIEIMQIYSDDVSVTYNYDQIIIDPPKNLEPETEYLIYIDDDAFTTHSGNYLEELGPALNWSFTTKIKKESLNLNASQEPSFYPNPAATDIRFKNIENVKSLHISNLTGRNIMEIKSPGTKLSLNSLPKGMYFITFISSDGSRNTKKLLKK